MKPRTGPRPSRENPNEWAQLRHAAGMTQAQWADAIGANVRTIKTWEAGVATPHKIFRASIEKASSEAGVE